MSTKIISDFRNLTIDSHIKTILLDIDNTCYEYEPCHKAALEKAQASIENIVGPLPDFTERYASAQKKIKARIPTHAASHSRILYFLNIFEQLGRHDGHIYVKELDDEYWETFFSVIQKTLGLEDFLTAVKKNGVKIVAVSDLTTSTQCAKIKALGIEHFIDYLVTSEEAGADKPDTAPFLVALEKSGGEAATSLVIGDSIEKDFGGAQALGMTTILLKHGHIKLYNDLRQRIDIATIAQKIGSRPDYVQGGGGNVSIKLDANTMAVKASGFRLEDLGLDTGLVDINYVQLRDYCQTPPTTSDLSSLIKDCDAVVTASIYRLKKGESLRPSIETGFHAILGNVVIHTHSVYANLLTCAKEGQIILKELFPEAIFIPYNTPGIALTYAIQEAIDTSNSNIFFLENHGLITVGETPESAFDLHEKINTAIKERFLLNQEYATLSLNMIDECWVANSPYLSEFIRQNPTLMTTITDTILFPDQVVYGEQISFDTSNPGPVTINLLDGMVTCLGSAGFARAAVETLVAWAYLIKNIPTLGLTIQTLPQTEGIFIANLDSEKYRKGII